MSGDGEKELINGQPPLRSDTEGTAGGVKRILARPDAVRLGRLARHPGQIPWPGWRAALGRTLRSMISDRVSLAAAGCAFYATLALFPAISMLISVYGLIFDPETVEPQLQVLQHLLPPAAFTLIADRVHMLINKQSGTLGINLVISVLVTLWSAMTGTKSMLAALNVAYDESEQRGFLRYQATAFAITLAAILAVVVGLAILVFMPATLQFLGLTAHQKGVVQTISYAMLIVFVMASLSVLYRFGPSRQLAKWKWITPGSLLATALWLGVSALFSWYVANMASYDATYGPLAAVVGVLMWFYLTAFVVLLGAELNSELELQTARDSTTGPPKPIGKRGAYVADHVADRTVDQ